MRWRLSNSRSICINISSLIILIFFAFSCKSMASERYSFSNESRPLDHILLSGMAWAEIPDTKEESREGECPTIIGSRPFQPILPKRLVYKSIINNDGSVKVMSEIESLGFTCVKESRKICTYRESIVDRRKGFDGNGTYQIDIAICVDIKNIIRASDVLTMRSTVELQRAHP